MNCFDFLEGGNICLWMLIILLIICLCKNGILGGIFNSCYCLPLAALIICCFCKNGKGLFGNGFGGCGCK